MNSGSKKTDFNLSGQNNGSGRKQTNMVFTKCSNSSFTAGKNNIPLSNDPSPSTDREMKSEST